MKIYVCFIANEDCFTALISFLFYHELLRDMNTCPVQCISRSKSHVEIYIFHINSSLKFTSEHDMFA